MAIAFSTVPAPAGHTHLSPPDCSALSEPEQDQLVQLFKLLSSVPRLQIIQSLVREGELNVTDLCVRLQQTQPAVSHHLAALRSSGAIRLRRDGKHSYYKVDLNLIENAIVTFLKGILELTPVVLPASSLSQLRENLGQTDGEVLPRAPENGGAELY